MRKSRSHEYRQAYNAQAVVDAEGSQLILGARVSQCASDRGELVATIEAIPASLGRPEMALADNGYAHGAEVESLAKNGVAALVATGAEGRRRRHDFRPGRARRPAEGAPATLEAMAEKLADEPGRALLRTPPRPRRADDVTVLGSPLAGRATPLRGEWRLVALATNCKRLHELDWRRPGNCPCWPRRRRRPGPGMPNVTVLVGTPPPPSAGRRGTAQPLGPKIQASSPTGC